MVLRIVMVLASVLVLGVFVAGAASWPAPATTAEAAISSSRPAGLVQAGDSKTICIVDEPDHLAQDDKLTGVNYNCVETYTDADPTWADWVNPWITSPNELFVPWVAADPTHHSLIDTQNLIPDSEASNPNWTADCAAGDFNTYAKQFASKMVQAGLGYTVILLGHEMNGNWYNDSLGTTVAEWQQWEQCFAEEVTAMRSVPGAHFLFDWCVNANYRDIPLADFYPGNAYVDIIGIDFYDGSSVPLPASGTARWNALVAEPLGLDTVEAFAAAHAKPLSIPEWGTSTAPQPAGDDDDGAYVQDMAVFIASHDVAYQAWFNADLDHVLPLNPAVAPQSVAAYTAWVADGSFQGAVVAGVLNPAPLPVAEVASILLLLAAAALLCSVSEFSRRRRRRRAPLIGARHRRTRAHSLGRRSGSGVTPTDRGSRRPAA